MERTEYREQFFAEAKTDPYTHMLTKMWGEAWAYGYEQALEDAGQQRVRSRSELIDDGMGFLTNRQHDRDAETMIALAKLGSLLPPKGFKQP